MLLIDADDDHDNGSTHCKKNTYVLSPHDLVLTNTFLSPPPPPRKKSYQSGWSEPKEFTGAYFTKGSVP